MKAVSTAVCSSIVNHDYKVNGSRVAVNGIVAVNGEVTAEDKVGGALS